MGGRCIRLYHGICAQHIIYVRDFNGKVWQPRHIARTIEMEKVIIGTCIVLLFIHNAFDVRMNVGRILYAQTQTTCRTAGVLFQP